MRRRTVAGFILCLASCGAVAQDAADRPSARGLATVAGTVVTEAALEEAAAPDFARLEEQRLQFEVLYATDRHRIRTRALERIIEERVLAAEAAERHVDVQELLSRELRGKIAPVTSSDIDVFYRMNKARLGQPQSEVAAQIRQFLETESGNRAKSELVERLKKKYAVTIVPEPLRLPVPTAGSASRGPSTAAVTIVEFADFQCPYCATLAPVLRSIMEDHPDDVRVVFRHFPLDSLHAQAREAAQASLCAGEQGQFWPMHDSIYSTPDKLDGPDLTARARALHLNEAVFEECMSAHLHAGSIERDLREGSILRVKGTPTLFINGRRFESAATREALDKVVEEELISARAGPRHPWTPSDIGADR